MVLNLSCPAVSQICILTDPSGSYIVLIRWSILEFKIDANGGEIALLEGVVSESTEEGGFADRTITN